MLHRLPLSASFWGLALVAIATWGNFADSQWDQYGSRSSTRDQRPRYESHGNHDGERYPLRRSNRNSYNRRRAHPSQGHHQQQSYNRPNYNPRPTYNKRPTYNNRPKYDSENIYDRKPTYNSQTSHNSRNTYNKRPNYDSYSSNNYNRRPSYNNNNNNNNNNNRNNYNRPNRQSRPKYDSYSSNRRSGHNTKNNYRPRHNNYSPNHNSRKPSYDTYHSNSHARNQHTRSSIDKYSRPQSSVRWYKPASSYRRRTTRPRTSNRRGYYQADYDLGKDDYHRYKYPKIPTHDFSHSHDTSGYYSHKKHKISCYQCNYKPGKPKWKLVTQRKSVPDPYYPFRYMSVKVKKYVRHTGAVEGGWDKCQGALSRDTAEFHGIYQGATCEGSCYVRMDKNGMVYRGCYAGEWKVNPHTHGCSYQAGSLYCFCRGDRCNGFVAPLSYSDPYPSGYNDRRSYPYPADYPRTTQYDPYPEMSSYRQSHPMRGHGHRHRRDVQEEETLTENEVELYQRLLGANSTEASAQAGQGQLQRSCYQCSPSEGCRGPVKSPGEVVTTDTDCYGHCYVKLDADQGVSRGCFSGEVGVNQHLIGCHVQQGATYCFCRGTKCNNFSVTMETPQNEVKTVDVTTPPTNSTQVEVKVKETKIETLEPELNVKYPVVLYYIEFPSE